ncbi:MAG: 16S rRNA (guanine(527)-N(7))-methyltransferase RsmG [Marinosulfonomonas sp.]|nr:MAG: 16S rRNA (guanine(527)-N(7))-methyltransferase RsmG [Marinosulfonomonas sp.]
MGDDYREEFKTAFNVSRETLVRLDQYAALLEKWNPAINLVSKTTIETLWQRHFHDSAQIFQFHPKNACHWVDLGSGGGFPALVLAVFAKEYRPNDRFTLVESDIRKVAFLQTVTREIGLNATVIAERIEKTPPLEADILTARALSSLDKLLEYASYHLKSSGIAIFPKGETYKKEIDGAFAFWNFDVEEFTSKTNPSGAILKIGGISRV